MAMKPFKEWKPWQRGLTIGVAAVLLLYGILLAVALPSNGTTDQVYLSLGTFPAGDPKQGQMYIRCDEARSTPGVCDPAGTDGNPDHARIVVHKRDKVAMHVTSDDGGGRAHDFKMDGMAYFLPPMRMEMEMHHMTQSKTITAWMSGTYHIKCEVGGHEAAGMWGTLVVQ